MLADKYFGFKFCLGTMLSLALFCTAFADEIYKTIDKKGHVQYSTIPPTTNDTVETITTHPEPSEEDIRAAQQNLKQLKDNLENRTQTRVEQEQEDSSEQEGDAAPKRNPFPPLAPFLHVNRQIVIEGI
ncbi:MAG: DUF4124 domain-containing protein [bacterium]